MTKEEAEKISAMKAGKELDRLVATKVMNWYQVGVTTCIVDGDYHRQPVWTDIKQADPLGWGRPVGLCIPVSNWKPSSDISAAWDVVYKMTMLAYDMSLLLHSPGTEPITKIYLAPDWYCDFRTRGEISPPEYEWVDHQRTAPEAICKAALLAKHSFENKQGDDR